MSKSPENRNSNLWPRENTQSPEVQAYYKRMFGPQISDEELASVLETQNLTVEELITRHKTKTNTSK